MDFMSSHFSGSDSACILNYFSGSVREQLICLCFFFTFPVKRRREVSDGSIFRSVFWWPAQGGGQQCQFVIFPSFSFPSVSSSSVHPPLCTFPLSDLISIPCTLILFSLYLFTFCISHTCLQILRFWISVLSSGLGVGFSCWVFDPGTEGSGRPHGWAPPLSPA